MAFLARFSVIVARARRWKRAFMSLLCCRKFLIKYFYRNMKKLDF